MSMTEAWGSGLGSAAFGAYGAPFGNAMLQMQNAAWSPAALQQQAMQQQAYIQQSLDAWTVLHPRAFLGPSSPEPVPPKEWCGWTVRENMLFGALVTGLYVLLCVLLLG